jgi:hypothetical protein
MLTLSTFSIRHPYPSACDLTYISILKSAINYSFVSYKHHNLMSFCWPMFNMIMLCQLSPGLEFLVTEIAFEFLPIERIEFHYFYYWYMLHINQRFKISKLCFVERHVKAPSIIHMVSWPFIAHDLRGLACWTGYTYKLLSNSAWSSDRCMQPCPAIHVEVKRRWEKNIPDRKKKGSLHYMGVDIVRD